MSKTVWITGASSGIGREFARRYARLGFRLIHIILHPYAPKVLNNVGFAYLTVACIDSAAFAANLPLFFGVYIVGSLVFNGGCVLLLKPARYLAARSIKNDVKADA